LGKILFCVLVVLRWADCELECEKPDHKTLPRVAREQYLPVCIYLKRCVLLIAVGH
jgi:hypothetical protein